MDKILKQLLEKMEEMSADIKEMKPKVEESHTWLAALYKANEFHKADIDQMQHKIAKLEGSLKGAAKQILTDLKDASNQ